MEECNQSNSLDTKPSTDATVAVAGPNPFCETLPTQRKAWDATSLRYYMECPRKYYYALVEGRRTKGNADITFGSIYHECVETYDRLRATGSSKPDATLEAYRLADRLSWGWSGQYLRVWRCNNWRPLKKGTRYLCKAAKNWWIGERDKCPICTTSASNKVSWTPENRYKNRHTLMRSVLFYCDNQLETGGVQPYVFADGQVGVEVSFTLPLDISSPDGDPYLLCGHFDSWVTAAGEVVCRERKTTKGSLSDRFFSRYSPDVQIDTYDLAGWLLYGETLKPGHVMVEVMQVGVEFSRMQRGYVSVSEGRREETLDDIKGWIKKAEADAKVGYYPKNTAACNGYGADYECPFRSICREEPGQRKALLDDMFITEHWNPLRTREKEELVDVSDTE